MRLLPHFGLEGSHIRNRSLSLRQLLHPIYVQGPTCLSRTVNDQWWMFDLKSGISPCHLVDI